MEHHPAIWGRSRTDHLLSNQSVPKTICHLDNVKTPLYLINHTQQPIVTGASVLAVCYQGGIIMAADCLGRKEGSLII